MTYFNPLFIVTRAIVKAVKKLYRGIKETAAFSGSGLSKINFFALRNIRKDKLAAITGDVTQLAAISPTVDHERF